MLRFSDKVVASISPKVSPFMSDLLSFDLSKEQRDVLLQGLRYVRSSIMLTVEDPTPEYVNERTSRLSEVSLLASMLTGTPAEKAVLTR